MPVRTDATVPQCAYCGLTLRQFLAYCNAENCRKWFCNGTRDGLGKSHIIAHCGKSKHTIISVYPQNVSEPYQPKCSRKTCTVRNIFELAVESRSEPFNKRKTWCRKHAVGRDLVGRGRWNTLVAAHPEDGQSQQSAESSFFIRLSAWFLPYVPQAVMDDKKAASERGLWGELALDKETVDVLEEFWRFNPRGTKRQFLKWKEKINDFYSSHRDDFANTNAYWKHWNRLVLELSRQEKGTIESLPPMRKVGAEWINNDYNTDIEVFVPQGVLSEFLEKGQLVHITFPVLQADGELMDRAATISARRLADNGDYIIIHCFKPVDAEGDRVIEGLTVQLVYNDIHFWRMRQALYKVQNDSMCMSPQVLDAVLGRWALADEALTSASSSASADSGISVRQFSVAEHASDVADEEIEEEVNEIEAPPLRTITTTQRINRAPRPFHTEYEDSVSGFRNFCFNVGHPPVNNVLNAKQKEAVQMALINPVSLIQGPPGTGKTKTAVAIIRSLLQDPQAKILVCAPSNVAIDDLTLKIATADRGLKILRLLPHGRDIACVNRDVEQYTVNSKFRRNFPNVYEPEIWLLRKFELECVEQAQIVCTTCNSAGLSCLSKVSFPYVLIDEAAQAMEPECLIAITRACEKIILIGDAEQLGAVVRFPNLQESQLATSLFERLWGADHCPANVRVTLTQQYRMHPAISMMVSQITYEDQLVDDDGVLNRTSTSSILDEIYTFSTNIHRIKEHDFLTGEGFFGRVNGNIPMVFVDLARNDELAGSGTSFVNMGEAHVIARLVSNLLHRGDEEARRPSSQDIGIITFYNGQRSQLRIDLRRHADAHNLPPIDVEINSVDGFQGREKEIIILSCVRSAETYMGRSTLGFTDDRRRLNVAMSRAKEALIIVGNSEVFEHSEIWQQYFKYIPRVPLDIVCRFLPMPCSTLPQERCQICPEGNPRRVQLAMEAFEL